MTISGANAFLENEEFTLYTMNSISSGEYAVIVPKMVNGMVKVLIDLHEKSFFDGLKAGVKSKDDLVSLVQKASRFIKNTYADFILVYPMFNEEEYISVVHSSDKQRLFDEVKKIGAVTSEIYKKIIESGFDARSVDQKIIILEKTDEDTQFLGWLKEQMPSSVEGLKYVDENKEVSTNPFMNMNPFNNNVEAEKKEEVISNPIPNTGSSIFDNVTPSVPVSPVVPNDSSVVGQEEKVQNDIFAQPLPNVSTSNATVESTPVSDVKAEASNSTNSIFGDASVDSVPASPVPSANEETPKPVNTVDLEGTIAFRPLPGDTTQIKNENISPVNEAKSIEEVQEEHKASKGIVNLLILVVILVVVTLASVEFGKFLYSVYGG